nr:Inner membrane protein YqjE [Salmonella sp. NCTC 7297]
MVETRLRLAVVELEEEKANLFQLLLMVGLTMLFAAFGLMSLMVLVIWAIDPQYRLKRDDCYHCCAVSACANRRHLDFAQSASVHAITPYAARTG